MERGDEPARTRQAIASVLRGHGDVLVIEGAAGIGKSTLLHVLGEHATDYGVQTYRKLGIASPGELAPAMPAHAT
ncbi:MAG TPA: hypothetical protein VJ757_10590 [Pseudonocardiaceae bacterium]|nr:hypothetical protein [Pseudonocardiaceae bacterium]